MKMKSLSDEKLSIYLFIIVWTAYAVVFMTKNCYSAAMAAIVSDGILTKTQTGAISAVFYLVYAPMQIVGGFAADRYSTRKLMLIGLIGAGVANLIIYVTQNYAVMMITWACNAMIQFGIWPSVFKIVSTQLAAAHRPKCVFYISAASLFGLILSYICAAFVKQWQYNFLISAVLLFAVAVIWLFTSKFFEKHMVYEEREYKKAEKIKPGQNESMLKTVFKSGLILLAVAAAVRGMLDLGIKALTPVMITESYAAISPSLATGLNTVLIVAGFFGLYIARILFPGRVHDESSSLAILFFITIPALCVIIMVGKISAWAVVIALALIVMLMSGAGQFTNLYIADRFRKSGRCATVSGILNGAASFGVVIANYMFAKLADDFGWRTTVESWIALAVLAMLFSLAAVPLWRKFLKQM